LKNVWKKYSWKVLKAEDGKIEKDQESMTEKRKKESSCGSKQEGPLISKPQRPTAGKLRARRGIICDANLVFEHNGGEHFETGLHSQQLQRQVQRKVHQTKSGGVR
jgi:hypothetical protein